MSTKSATGPYSPALCQRLTEAIQAFSEPVWDSEITDDWSWHQGAGKQSELASVITIDAFCGIAEHPSKRIDELLPWAVAGELAKLAPTSEFCAIGIN